MKTYLGDAVYAEWARGMLTLTVEYGAGPVSTVHLEPQTYIALLDFAERIKAHEQNRDSAPPATDESLKPVPDSEIPF